MGTELNCSVYIPVQLILPQSDVTEEAAPPLRTPVIQTTVTNISKNVIRISPNHQKFIHLSRQEYYSIKVENYYTELIRCFDLTFIILF